MREVNRLRFRTAFLRVDFLWPAEPAALHTLNEHHDAANMQLFSVDVDTFDFLDGIAAATSPDWIDANNSGRFNLDAPLCIAAAAPAPAAVVVAAGPRAHQWQSDASAGAAVCAGAAEPRHDLYHCCTACATPPGGKAPAAPGGRRLRQAAAEACC